MFPILHVQIFGTFSLFPSSFFSTTLLVWTVSDAVKVSTDLLGYLLSLQLDAYVSSVFTFRLLLLCAAALINAMKAYYGWTFLCVNFSVQWKCLWNQQFLIITLFALEVKPLQTQMAHKCRQTAGTTACVNAKLGSAFVYLTLMARSCSSVCNSCHLCLEIMLVVLSALKSKL